MYLVMADNREKIIGVSDTARGARGAPNFILCRSRTNFSIKFCAFY